MRHIWDFKKIYSVSNIVRMTKNMNSILWKKDCLPVRVFPWSFNSLKRRDSSVWKAPDGSFISQKKDANGWLQIISALSATVGNWTVFLDLKTLTGLEMGITTEASQGAIFKSFLLQSVDCLIQIPWIIKCFFFLFVYHMTSSCESNDSVPGWWK